MCRAECRLIIPSNNFLSITRLNSKEGGPGARWAGRQRGLFRYMLPILAGNHVSDFTGLRFLSAEHARTRLLELPDGDPLARGDADGPACDGTCAAWAEVCEV